MPKTLRFREGGEAPPGKWNVNSNSLQAKRRKFGETLRICWWENHQSPTNFSAILQYNMLHSWNHFVTASLLSHHLTHSVAKLKYHIGQQNLVMVSESLLLKSLEKWLHWESLSKGSPQYGGCAGISYLPAHILFLKDPTTIKWPSLRKVRHSL